MEGSSCLSVARGARSFVGSFDAVEPHPRNVRAKNDRDSSLLVPIRQVRGNRPLDPRAPREGTCGASTRILAILGMTVRASRTEALRKLTLRADLVVWTTLPGFLGASWWGEELPGPTWKGIPERWKGWTRKWASLCRSRTTGHASRLPSSLRWGLSRVDPKRRSCRTKGAVPALSLRPRSDLRSSSRTARESLARGGHWRRRNRAEASLSLQAEEKDASRAEDTLRAYAGFPSLEDECFTGL
ncbi:hypothetical protein KM043_003277 [Ampulex compressa]|nr:hypothetical protein KM043_003277 [Ampulex compressa]